MKSDSRESADVLLASLLEGSAPDGTEVALLDAIQSGYPMECVDQLLRSPRRRAARAGAWIASELGREAGNLASSVRRALSHADFYVRFFALDAVLSIASSSDGPLLGAALGLLDDDHSAVRWKAMHLLAVLSPQELDAARRFVEDTNDLRMLLEWAQAASPEGAGEVQRLIQDADPRRRRVAVAVAARIRGSSPSPIAYAKECGDEEVRRFARDF
jgi:hypothetical protein